MSTTEQQSLMTICQYCNLHYNKQCQNICPYCQFHNIYENNPPPPYHISPPYHSAPPYHGYHKVMMPVVLVQQGLPVLSVCDVDRSLPPTDFVVQEIYPAKFIYYLESCYIPRPQ